MKRAIAMFSVSSVALVPALGSGTADALECKVQQSTPEVASRIPAAPSWFAKVHASGQYAFYIAGGNHILRLEDNNPATRDIEIPGWVDPVPSHDGKILTIPGLAIYAMDDVLAHGRDARPLLEDSSHGGVYQSVATLDAEGDERLYRVITDTSGEVNYRDYRINFASNPPAIEALGEVAQLCPGRTYKTIMISKTSKYIGVYDPGSGTSKLVSGDGRCQELFDLGYPTGKLEFSYDDTRVAFHVDYFDDGNIGNYFSGVSSMVSKDVFVMDLEQTAAGVIGKNLRRMTQTMKKGSGAYYPSFDRSGRLVYVFDDADRYSFHVTHAEDVESYGFHLPPPHGWPGGTPPAGVPADWKQRIHAAAALGSLWAEQCPVDSPAELSAVDAASNFLGISQADCEELARSQWDGARSRIAALPRFSRDTRFDPTLVAQLSSDDLLALCRDNRPRERHTRVYGELVRERLTGERVIANYCVGCHDGPTLRRPDGSTTANPIDFHQLTEAQILASLGRMNLPEGHRMRMPPPGSEFQPPFQIDGETVDHRQAAIDYLEEQLERVRRGPAALTPAAAPARLDCQSSVQDWLAFRDDIAYKVSQGQSVNFGSVKPTLDQCQEALQQQGLDECLGNLRNHALVQTLPAADRKLNFEVSDTEYYRQIPREAVSLPTAAEGIDLSNGIPDNWREVVARQGNVHALQYRSRTVVNPGRAGSLNRLLFLVEGEQYDKWIQFTLPEPELSIPDDRFDPTGLQHGTGPEQLVDFIAIDKRFAPRKIYFAQFWRDQNGRNPQPRLAAYRRAYGIQGGNVDNADTCYSCHPGGMRRISPQPGSVSREATATLELYNARMDEYLDGGMLDWNGAIHPEYYGPPRGADVGCISCHNNGGPGFAPQLNRGPITSELAPNHLRHKLMTDLSMPMEAFVHNPASPAQPTPVGAVVGYLRSINYLPDALRIPLSKLWIGATHNGSTGAPDPQQVARDLQRGGVFDRDFTELFGPEGTPYLAPDMELSASGFADGVNRVLQYRRDLLGRLEDTTRYNRHLGHWLKQECIASELPH